MTNMLTQHEKDSIVEYCCTNSLRITDQLWRVDNYGDLYELAHIIIDETIKRVIDKGYCVRKHTTYEKPPRDEKPAELRLVKECYDPSLGKRD